MCTKSLNSNVSFTACLNLDWPGVKHSKATHDPWPPYWTVQPTVWTSFMISKHSVKEKSKI